MKRAVKVFLGILAIIITLVIGTFSYIKKSLTPQYQGEISIPGLPAEVEVYFTEYGIPHIYSQRETDAYFALGYIHAQDRLWQMDLLRRVGGARLSELFGADLVKTDIYLRTMGIAKYAQESADRLRSENSKTLELTEAYIRGINTFIDEGPGTLEHLLLGIDMTPYTLENVFEVLGYMSFSFANAQKTDPLVTELYQKLDSSYLQDLPLFHEAGNIIIPVSNSPTSNLVAETNKVLSKLPLPLFVGSNSWVLGPEKTNTGNSILVNDPHIGYAQPCVWYEAHLSHDEGEFYGYFLGGYPFPPLMHNAHAATGLTMFENDDIDFYIERVNPNDPTKYWHKGQWVPFETRQELINIKGGQDTTVTVQTTVHGAIVSDILDKPLPEKVSMYWVYNQRPNDSFDATYLLTKVKKAEDVAAAAAMIHGPGLNVMFGSNRGEYAWWASGALIYRKDERTSKTFRDGASGLAEPDSLRPFHANPKSVNPGQGFVYSANNQPGDVDGTWYSGYYLPDDRAERINQILVRDEVFGVDDMKKMLLDNESVLFRNIKETLLAEIEDQEPEIRNILNSWQGTFNADEVAPTIFQRWTFEILALAFGDEMDSLLWESFRSTHLFKRSIEPLVVNEESVWWDNINTTEVETRKSIVVDAFQKTVQGLSEEMGSDLTKWTWGQAHTLTHGHAMGVNPTLGKLLNVGPFSVPATNEVINNLGFRWTGSTVHKTTFGPSTRRIVDLADPRNNSWSVLPTGQSGNLFSAHYDDQAQMFVNGDFRKMMMNEEEIKADGKRLLLIPSKP